MNADASPPARWPLPSARVRELLRQGAEIALNAPPEWLHEIDEASLSADVHRRTAADPVLVAATRRVNRSALVHWAAANLDAPGAPVPRHISPDMLGNARELVRRGETDLLMRGARAAQDVAWQRWMAIAFGLTQDPRELQELLEVSARSIAAFLQDNVEAIAAFMQAEREERSRGTHADRRELVTRILEGDEAGDQQAGQRLGYALDHAHHAAVIWTEEADSQLAALERAAQALARGAGTQQVLTVMANAATLWVWADAGKPLDLQPVQQAAKALPGVRVAIGSTGHGVEGFRRAHLDALTAQRVAGRLHAGVRVVSHEEVRLVSLLTRDAEAARRFGVQALGELAAAAPVLRQALHTFLAAGCNATLAAQLLHTHRNTLLRRLDKATQLLPRPLEHGRIEVAAALEVLSWTTDGRRPA